MLVKNVVDRKFVGSYLPKLIYIKTKELSKNKRCKEMDNYLKNNLDITLRDAIKEICDNYTIKEVNDIYVLEPNGNLSYKGQRLDMLMRLIDIGNTEIKGTGIFTNACKFLNEHEKLIYFDYMQKGEKYGS